MDVKAGVASVEKSTQITMKPAQRAALIALCDGEDVFMAYPTGFGKSKVFTMFPKVKDLVTKLL